MRLWIASCMGVLLGLAGGVPAFSRDAQALGIVDDVLVLIGTSLLIASLMALLRRFVHDSAAAATARPGDRRFAGDRSAPDPSDGRAGDEGSFMSASPVRENGLA